MRKLFAFFSIIACYPLITSPIHAAGGILQVAADYEIYFNQFIEDRSYPGAAFAVVSRDRLLHLATTGHTTVDRIQPINPDTTFRLASVSKTFAAELVGLLVEDGALNWDDPITRYVPAFRIDGDTSRIRIRHLLGQSTGLIPHAYDNLLEHGKEMDTIWKKMSDLSFICRPGQCYGYQNSVFSLIDPVVEHATDLPYETLLERLIFRPLDMNTASLGYRAFVNNPNHAKPHRRQNGRWNTVDVQQNYYRAAPAAGVNASILDMSKWLRAQLGNNPEVLPPQLVEFLRIPRVKTRRELYRKQWKTMLSNAHYGLGWRIYQMGQEQLIYHGGWVSGFRADVAFSPQHDIGFVVLINAESSGISELTTRFWQMALAPQPVVASP